MHEHHRQGLWIKVDYVRADSVCFGQQQDTLDQALCRWFCRNWGRKYCSRHITKPLQCSCIAALDVWNHSEFQRFGTGSVWEALTLHWFDICFVQQESDAILVKLPLHCEQLQKDKHTHTHFDGCSFLNGYRWASRPEHPDYIVYRVQQQIITSHFTESRMTLHRFPSV